MTSPQIANLKSSLKQVKSGVKNNDTEERNSRKKSQIEKPKKY